MGLQLGALPRGIAAIKSPWVDLEDKAGLVARHLASKYDHVTQEDYEAAQAHLKEAREHLQQLTWGDARDAMRHLLQAVSIVGWDDEPQYCPWVGKAYGMTVKCGRPLGHDGPHMVDGGE